MSTPSIREQWNAPNFNRAAVALWGALILITFHGCAVWISVTEGVPLWLTLLLFAPIGWLMVAIIFASESLGAAVSTTVKQWSKP